MPPGKRCRRKALPRQKMLPHVLPRQKMPKATFYKLLVYGKILEIDSPFCSRKEFCKQTRAKL